MEIISVVPSTMGSPAVVYIMAENNEVRCTFQYSIAYQLLKDPHRIATWMPWSGGTLNEALKYIMELTTLFSALEQDVIRIIRSLLNLGQESIYIGDIEYGGIPANIARGVLSSLVKKNVIYIDTANGGLITLLNHK